MANPYIGPPKEDIFTASEAFGYGWQRAKENFWLFAFLMCAVLAMGVARNHLEALIRVEDESLDDLLESCAGLWLIVMKAYFNSAIILASIRVRPDRRARLSDLAVGVPFLIVMFATCLYALATLIGLVLFVVPGLYFGSRYFFFMHFILDQGQGPFQAMRSSARLTKGRVFLVFNALALSILICLGGFLLCFVGAFWAVPTAWIGLGYIYHKLQEARNPSHLA